jgi:hypothetical protein
VKGIAMTVALDKPVAIIDKILRWILILTPKSRKLPRLIHIAVLRYCPPAMDYDMQSAIAALEVFSNQLQASLDLSPMHRLNAMAIT